MRIPFGTFLDTRALVLQTRYQRLGERPGDAVREGIARLGRRPASTEPAGRKAVLRNGFGETRPSETLRRRPSGGGARYSERPGHVARLSRRSEL